MTRPLGPRFVLTLGLVLLLTSTLAQGLPDALAQAEARSGVVTARLDLEDARTTQARTNADPTALRLDDVQAAQGVALAEAELRAARYAAYEEIAGAYLQVLEATAQANLAREAVALSEQALDIARIRRDRGAATDLDVRDAENDLASARSDLTAAAQGAALAQDAYASLVNLPADALTPVSDDLLDVPTPSMDDLTRRLEEAPNLLRAVHGVELARIAVDLLDPSYAAQRDIDAAELQVTQAETSLTEARRGLALNAQSLLDGVERARETLTVASQALDNARERDDVDASRLAAGLIADVAYQRTRLATLQAELAVLQARHGVLRALLALQQGTGVAIEGLDAF